MTLALTELTDDPLALEVLEDDMLDIVEPDDPYYRELTRITSKIAALRGRMKGKRVKICEMILAATPKTEIIAKLSTTYQTINDTIASTDGQEFMALTLRTIRIRRGPSLEARAALLWRIATSNEETNPRIAIAAVDTLNKQEGIYKPTEIGGDGALTVNIQNFTVNTPRDMQLTNNTTPIEGEFTTVDVQIPSTP